MASLAANFWIISSGVMPLGGAEFNGLAPSSQLVSANRTEGSRRVKETIVTHRHSFLKFIIFPRVPLFRPKSLKRVVKPAINRAITGPESGKNLDCPVLQEGTMRRFAFILIVLIAGSFVQLSAQSKRPFTFEDMMALKRISGPVISPDGKWVLFSAMDVSLKDNKKTTHLWLVPLAGGESRQLTSDPAGEDRGRWSPDGKQFLFTSGRDGSSQIWLANFD